MHVWKYMRALITLQYMKAAMILEQKRNNYHLTELPQMTLSSLILVQS